MLISSVLSGVLTGVLSRKGLRKSLQQVEQPARVQRSLIPKVILQARYFTFILQGHLLTLLGFYPAYHNMRGHWSWIRFSVCKRITNQLYLRYPAELV